MRSLALLFSLLVLAAMASPAGASVTVAQSGWSWGNPSPQGNSLQTIDFVGGRGFAAGAAGTVLRTDDAGATWTGLATGTSAGIDRLQVVDADTVVFLGGNGCVLRRSDDGGLTFHKVFIVAEQNCPAPVQAFTFVGKQVGYLLLRDGSVMRTADAGVTFARQTAVPGTSASTGGGTAKPVDIAFTDQHTGYAFVAPGQIFSTTDDGVSWKPVTAVDPGTIARVWFFDAKTAFAVGPDTLLQTTDGGTTWKALASGPGRNLTSIRCADVKTCLLTVDGGALLLRTTDGGATVSEITASSQPVFAAAFASATRVVAVGAGGTTVVSDDGGVNYLPVSHDIGGAYFALRNGPGSSAFAVGSGGGLAATLDGGASWTTLAVPTSANVLDVSFVTADVGYALDVKGALFKTINGGLSWQTLDTGSTSPAKALAATADAAVLVGPQGVRRTDASGQFATVGPKALRKAGLTGIDVHGSLVVAYGSGTKNLFVSPDGGVSWKQMKLPSKKSRILPSSATAYEQTSPVSFVTAANGYLLDSAGRLWLTKNGGKKWTEMPATGTDAGAHVVFSSPAEGYLVDGSSGAGQAFILRTTDGAKTWRPELIGTGDVIDMVAGPGRLAFALIGDGRTNAARSLFFTASAGEAGSPVTLGLRTPRKVFTKKALKKAKNTVTVSGSLSGAQGGELITVSTRDLTGTGWTSKTVTAGANGGTFTTTWKISRSSVFVAQWAGESGRSAAGSPVLTITVKK